MFLIFQLNGIPNTISPGNIKSLDSKQILENDTLEIDNYKSLVDCFSFENYSVNEIYTGKIAKLDLLDYKELPKDIIDNIGSQYNNQKQPNFAGHYIIISWSCGSPCQMNAIIDAKSGKTIQFVNSANGLDFQVDSYLLIINPPGEDKYDKALRELVGAPDFKILENNELIDLK